MSGNSGASGVGIVLVSAGEVETVDAAEVVAVVFFLSTPAAVRYPYTGWRRLVSRLVAVSSRFLS